MKIELTNLDGNKIHDILLGAILPLPVALISTVDKDGTNNAAPFSLAIPVCYKPPIICVSIGLRQGQKKDTTRNIEFSKDFVVNIMDETLIKTTVQTGDDYPSNVDEMKEVGFTATTADKVKSPLIAEAQVSLECQFVKSLELGEGQNLRNIFFGEVVLVHVKDELWVEGSIQPSKLRAVGYTGGTYCRVSDVFEVKTS